MKSIRNSYTSLDNLRPGFHHKLEHHRYNLYTHIHRRNKIIHGRNGIIPYSY